MMKGGLGGPPAAKGAMLPGEGLNTIVLTEMSQRLQSISDVGRCSGAGDIRSVSQVRPPPSWPLSVGSVVTSSAGERRHSRKTVLFFRLQKNSFPVVFVNIWAAAGRV